MTRRPRCNHTPIFKSKVALAAISGERTLGELGQQLDVHPNQIKQGCDQLLAGAGAVFFGWEMKPFLAAPSIAVKTLHAKILERTQENIV
jgi:transposase